MDTDLRQLTGSCFGCFTEYRIFLAEINHIPEEIMDFFVFFQSVPIQPGCNIVLTVGIVITKLCITEFITRKKHCRATAAH